MGLGSARGRPYDDKVPVVPYNDKVPEVPYDDKVPVIVKVPVS